MTEQTSKTLAVLIDQQPAGSVTEHDGRLEFAYHMIWQADPTAIPLSLSMPLSAAVHGDRVTRAVLWGLLPDNDQVLERWARTYQVSSRNPFALLRHVGEDCAGAAQFAPVERVDALLAGEGNTSWIDDAAIAARLRALRRDPTAWHAAAGGQFSLAGAQAKTALTTAR